MSQSSSRDCALQQALKQHSGRLTSLIRGLVRDQIEAEDVLQDVFEELVTADDLGLVILARLLLGQGPRPSWGRGHFGPPWARCQQITPEDRIKLRQELHRRCSPQPNRNEEGESHA